MPREVRSKQNRQNSYAVRNPGHYLLYRGPSHVLYHQTAAGGGIKNWRPLDDLPNIFAEISIICTMKYKFQDPRLSLISPFLIHQEDKGSILAGAISVVTGDDNGDDVCMSSDLISHSELHSGTGCLPTALRSVTAGEMLRYPFQTSQSLPSTYFPTI